MPYPPQGGLEEIKGTNFDVTRDSLEHIGQHGTHASMIFPEATDESVTFTSHVAADTWSAWAEIVDNNAVTFSSKITSDTHICAIGIESTETTDLLWMIEIAYGAAYTPVARVRYVSQKTGRLDIVPSFRLRSEHIPTGETVYYRLMCSVGNNDTTIHLRYYYID